MKYASILIKMHGMRKALFETKWTFRKSFDKIKIFSSQDFVPNWS